MMTAKDSTGLCGVLILDSWGPTDKLDFAKPSQTSRLANNDCDLVDVRRILKECAQD
jgi:hypothetical protein